VVCNVNFCTDCTVNGLEHGLCCTGLCTCCRGGLECMFVKGYRMMPNGSTVLYRVLKCGSFLPAGDEKLATRIYPPVAHGVVSSGLKLLWIHSTTTV